MTPDPTPTAKFNGLMQELVTEIEDTLRRQKALPAFILLYSAIDICASISRPVDHEETSGPVFRAWIDKYMLPFGSLRCTSDDLWGARCGLLHTSTSDSRHTRTGRGRQIAYCNDTGAANALESMQDTNRHVAVNYFELLQAFVEGVGKFSQALNSDKNLREVAEAHISQWVWMGTISDEEIGRALEGYKRRTGKDPQQP